MQFIKINKSDKLVDLTDKVGYRNVDEILHKNSIERTPNLGEAVHSAVQNALSVVTNAVDFQRKSTILNKLTDDSDVFEYAATQSSDSWKVLSYTGTFPMMLAVPEKVVIQRSVDVLGNGVPVGSEVYKTAMTMLSQPPHYIDPAIFNEYSSNKYSSLDRYDSQYSGTVFQWFKIPWGDVSLYSSISDEMIDFPVYPEDISDSRKANYTQMPDLLYQYEPWQLYQSSGPRQNTYKFKFHRDMWTGDHKDGKANELVRFCMANCYPEFNGSAVHTPIVTLYMKGDPLISGVMTDVSVDWSGPIGHDGFYLVCEMSISITEVSPQPLNYHSVKRMPLIG